jgi:hypothetical protein
VGHCREAVDIEVVLNNSALLWTLLCVHNRRIYHPSMSAFTFDFDLEDDLDESFDAIPTQKPTAVNNTDNAALDLEGVSETELPAEEIPLSELVRTPSLLRPSILTTACRRAALRAPRSALVLAPRAARQRPHACTAGPVRCTLPAAGGGARRAGRPCRRAGGPRPWCV